MEEMHLNPRQQPPQLSKSLHFFAPERIYLLDSLRFLSINDIVIQQSVSPQTVLDRDAHAYIGA